MENTVRDIEEKARSLSAEERERLAFRLFESVHYKELNEVDDAWLAVAEERAEAYRSSQDTGISEDEFFNGIEKELKWK